MSLRSYVVTRLLLTIPMILLLLSIVFIVVRVLPGDPVLLHFEKHAKPEDVERLRQNLGLDKPLHVQYARYLVGIIGGDFGKSMQDFSPVAQQIFSAFPATLELAICAIVVAVVTGVLLGVRASRFYGSLQDHSIRAFGVVMYAIPVFFLGMVFQMVFGIGLHWFPTGGRIYPTLEPRGLLLNMSRPESGFLSTLLRSLPVGLVAAGIIYWLLRRRHVAFRARGLAICLSGFTICWLIFAALLWHYSGVGVFRLKTGLFTIDSILEGSPVKLVEALRYLFLPSLTLGLVLCGIFIRLTRSNMLETLRLDFVSAARARGLKENSVIYGYALRNAFLPVLTMMGLQFAALLGGAILTETTFSWPGLGRYLVDRINFRDYTGIQGAVVLFGLMVALVSLVVDVLYAYLDPRIRL